MTLQIGELTVDRARRRLQRGTQVIHLSPKAWKLLEVLLDSDTKALSKAELCGHVWPDTHVQEANLANLVREVREVLGDDARKPRHLRTVHGYGYALEIDPEPVPGESPLGVTYRLVWGVTEVDLVEGENVIGRDRQATIWLADESISRRHARVQIGKGGATLEDLGSKNGTFHRGKRLTAPVKLADGDDLAVGSVGMTFREISTTASTVTHARTGETE